MTRALMTWGLWTLCVVVSWGANPWLEDFDSAKRQAVAAHKPILVEATGSDWCLPGQQMEAEVFNRPDFLPVATTKYILLRLDYPRNFALPERRRAQNQTLAERYFVRAFPTFLLMDERGVVFARHAGYIAGGVTAFLGWAAGAEAQQSALKTLEATVEKAVPGIPKAQAQDALFRQAEAWGLEWEYAALPFQIVEQDAEGKAGLKPRYQVYNAYQRRLATWAQDDFRKAVDDFGDLANRATPWPELRQKILLTQAMVSWDALNDEIRARDILRQTRALGGDTAIGRRANELLDQLP